MKKGIIILVCLFTAQLGFSQAHQQGDIIISPGVSFGNYLRNYDAFTFSPSAYLDFGIHDYFSAGPYAGFAIGDGIVGVGVGGRANFHFYQLIADNVRKDIKSDVLDIYLNAFLGFEFGNDPVPDHLTGGLSLGLRYYPVERFGVFVELGGTPMGYSTIGANIKLYRK